MSDRNYYKAAVFVIVRNTSGEVLLQRRKNTGYMDGYYDFPSGHLELGETMPAAAVRELYEEVGLQCAEKDLRLIHLNQSMFGDYYLNYIFEAMTWQGEPVIGEPEKCSAVCFYPLDELPEKCTVSVRDVVRTDFGEAVSYSAIDARAYESLMGEPHTAT